ncbi:septum formation initiator family protein [Oceanobacillus piezotolerans]|uniref:Septum formation initiator family protein n=1 Tax=Oceanobacillus piezotolerans TaxID=2448030 RepID=A0A498D715_9BACI|nr:septum formation initiator family protein [Oceanobacillus piezotolerans]RLL41674.1 septum formation initiator family protein [Oceanobacillus piezotolerans]
MASQRKSVARIESNYMHQYDAYIIRQKRKKQRIIRRLVLFSLIMLFAFGCIAGYHIKQRTVHAEQLEQYEQLERELADLEKEEKMLREEIELLQNEDYVLDIARTNYFLSKEGELIFKIPEEEPSY